MKVIDLLDSYVAGNRMTEIDEKLLDAISSSASDLVSGVLVGLKKRGCVFSYFENKPSSFVEAISMLSQETDISRKYVLAIFCLGFQHHIAKDLSEAIISRIEV